MNNFFTFSIGFLIFSSTALIFVRLLKIKFPIQNINALIKITLGTSILGLGSQMFYIQQLFEKIPESKWQ
jgi:hypothetical protein